MNILSLFDGMSCGQIAINRLGIKYDNYFASEIDKYAIQVTKSNYPNTIHLGSVIDVKGGNLPNIDLLIGGSPCQSFSFAGKRKGMSTKDEQEILTLEHYLELKEQGFEFEGQSYLFWEYMRLLHEVKPKYFLLENVMMGQKWEKILSKAIGVNPIEINSSLVSAQNRRRLYWTNIGLKSSGLFGDLESIIEQPKDKGILLKDVLENNVDEKYFLSAKAVEKILKHKEEQKQKGYGFGAVIRNENDLVVHNMQPRSGDPTKGGTGHLTRTDGKTYCLDTGNTNAVEILGGDFRYDEGFRWRDGGKTPTLCLKDNTFANINNNIRKLTPIECERLQTVPDNYTNHVSDSQRYKMLGNGWTVDVIAHIFKYMEL